MRNCTGGRKDFESNILRIKKHGVPNYFGQQRFGKELSNLKQLNGILREKVRIGSTKRKPFKRSLVISAARAYLFNQLLSERLNSKNWDTYVDGDVLNYELYFFVVEHQVVAYSSEEGAVVTTPFVSRATLGPYGGSLDAGEVVEHRDGWSVFTEQQHPNDGVVELDPRIIPGNIEIVAVLYDTDDESKSPSGANPKAGVSRAINSATPRSTAFDAIHFLKRL